MAKKELAGDPIVGTLGRLMDAAYIDRDDPHAAVESLHKPKSLAKKGLSVLISPEGTRLDTTEVGPFKKGPFRIAMAAGIPIVPVVIRNAEVIAARDSSTFNPGTVDVVVLPADLRRRLDRWTTCRTGSPRYGNLSGHAEDWPIDSDPKIGPYGADAGATAKKAAAKKARSKKAAAPKKAPRRRHAAKKGGRDRRRPDGPFTTTDDALVLASVSSPAERSCLTTGCEQHGASIPKPASTCCNCPTEIRRRACWPGSSSNSKPTKTACVVPVRVFWVPDGLSTAPRWPALICWPRPVPAARVAQQRILRGDPSRARVVAGEPAKVSELRQQWRDTTVAENPHDFARFRHPAGDTGHRTGRIPAAGTGIQVASAGEARDAGVGAVPRRAWRRSPARRVEKAGKMLDEMATGWSRFSVDLLPAMGRQVIKRGFDPEIDYDRAEIEDMRTALESHPAVLLFSHRSNLDGVVLPVAMQANRLPPAHTFGGINMSFGFMGPLMRRSGVIFIRRNIATIRSTSTC